MKKDKEQIKVPITLPAIQEWEVNIKHVSNGFICTYIEETDPSSFSIYREVIENNDDDSGYKKYETMRRLCWWIMDYFGFHQSKHDKYHLRLSITETDPKTGKEKILLE